ncbi:phage integrase SAM-like domain-containing protein [Bacteroides pyogenes]|uniref:phage integrase SAM-like domain-containing protein n=1 Tax=Bacteroides pyogenes TaxID=310300 RepID=UPI0037351344
MYKCRWVSLFEGYLLSQGLSFNTVSTYLRLLRAVYNRGIRCGAAAYSPHLILSQKTAVDGRLITANGSTYLV